MKDILSKALPFFFALVPLSASFSRSLDGELLIINDEFTRVFGFSREEVIGKNLQELGISPDTMTQESRVHDLEMPLHLKTGELRYFSINIDILSIDDEDYILKTYRDITFRILSEQDRSAGVVKLEKAYDATIQGWAEALELRDIETKGHSLRVAKMVIELARYMGIINGELSHLWRGAILHDIGKMGIPDSILLKPGRLTEEELIVMQTHPKLAFNMLSHVNFLRPALYVPYCHHEKWDGTGYPQGLKGEKIPRYARMFSIVDVYDALVYPRPYKEAWGVERALRHIELEKGISFDSELADKFIEMMKGQL